MERTILRKELEELWFASTGRSAFTNPGQAIIDHLLAAQDDAPEEWATTLRALANDLAVFRNAILKEIGLS